MSDGEVYLRWNNHNSTFMSSLASLFLREQWVDVTLAAQGKFINVHRLVLCACSQYFEDVLSIHKDERPIIFLYKVEFSIVEAIVEYMYKGEVNLNQNQLPNFFETAKFLQIKGLADDYQTLKVDSPSHFKDLQSQIHENKINESNDFQLPATSMDLTSHTHNISSMSNNVCMPKFILNCEPVTVNVNHSEPANTNQSTTVFNPDDFHLSSEVVDIDKDNFVSVSMDTGQDVDCNQNMQFKVNESTFPSESNFSKSQATVLDVKPLNDPSQLSSPYVVQKVVAIPCQSSQPKKRKSTSKRATTSSKELLRSKTDTCKYCWRRFYNCPHTYRSHMKECEMLPQSMRPQLNCPHCPHQCHKDNELKRHLKTRHQC